MCPADALGHLMLLIRRKNLCRCQAENPLKLLSEFARPATSTTAFALTLGVATASLGVTAAHAGSATDKSEVGGMVCHEGHQSANQCRGWTNANQS
jgi:hypothetical protein